MYCPLLLNHERTVINHIIVESWVKFHFQITSRPVESRNHLNRICLTKWSMLKETEQMRNKIVDMYQSGKVSKAISKALGLQRTTVRAIIHKWRKLGTVVNLPRSGRPTKITPRAQRRLIQEVIKEPRTTSKELQASLASIKVSVHDSTIRKSQKWHPWESSKAKATADQKEHKSSSHICQKISWLSPILLGKYSVDWDKSWTFWKVCVPLPLA